MTPASDFIPTLLDLAKKAGDRILTIYHQSDINVQYKENHSPLTQADLDAHQCIIEGLLQLTPDIPVLSEEGKNIPWEKRKQWTRYWLVDPLDGTREFLKRNGEFTVNIALIEHHYPIAGIIYAPVKQHFYYADKESLAYKKIANEPALPIHTKKVNPEKIYAAMSRHHGLDQLQHFIDQIPQLESLQVGSSLKFCLVAEGLADIYPRLSPTCEWDSAAAQCIVEQAGGQVLDLQGQRLRYNDKASLENPSFIVLGDNNFDWFSLLRT